MKTNIVVFSILFIFSFIGKDDATVHADMNVVVDSSTGIDAELGKDIVKASERDGLQLSLKDTEGPIDSIRGMVNPDAVSVAIVQSDVLGFLSRSNDESLRELASRLRLVFPFHQEDVHLFAQMDIERFEDLAGKRVVVGENGSRHWVTANNMLHMMKVEPGERLHLYPVEAASAVLLGEADAMFHVGEKPVKFFSNLALLAQTPKYENLLNNVHFVPLIDSKILDEYMPTTLNSNNYSWHADQVPTVAVREVLVSFDFSSRDTAQSSAGCAQVSQLASVIRDSMGDFRQTGHAKWREIDLNQATGIWEWDSCARAQPTVEIVQDELFLQALSKCLETGDCPSESNQTTTVAAIDHDTASSVQPQQPELSSIVSEPSVNDKLFRDCPVCPEMVQILAGQFVMGSTFDALERPPHLVKIDYPFAIAKYEVTVGSWKACVADGVCAELPKLEGAAVDMPVRNVAWTDTQSYIEWLSKKSGKTYRLPTEAEWEYAARATTDTTYWWGDNVEPDKSNCKDCGGVHDNKNPNQKGQYAANLFGLHDMNGNVWEWVADCWDKSYVDHPSDGSAWNQPDCRQRVLRGGSWRDDASYIRSASRFFYDADVRYSGNGFRVVVQPN